MLSNRERELLTAYVDGELSARQRRHVARLLQRSSAARQLLKLLKEDSGQLRKLSSPDLETDLAVPVLRTIAERHLEIRRQALRPPGVYPAWAGFAVVAALLLIVAAGSYFLFSGPLARDHSRRVDPPPNTPKAAEPTPPLDQPRLVEPLRDGSEEQQSPVAQPPAAAPPVEVVQRPPEQPSTVPGSVATDEPAVTADAMEMFKPEKPNVARPITVRLRDLDREATRTRLLGEWRQDTAFRLELPCKDGARAFDRLQAIWKARGNSLLIDQVAQGRLKRPQWKTNYVLLIEDLLPEELLQLLQQLAAEDRKGEAKRPPDVLFSSLVVTRMTRLDHKELSDLLGVDFSVATAGQGGGTRPDRQALALAYNPVRPRPGSAEVKRYLDNRKPGRPGTAQVLLVLRGPGS